jgi:hypothetical protein
LACRLDFSQYLAALRLTALELAVPVPRSRDSIQYWIAFEKVENLLRRFSIRRHRSEIMLGMLVVVLGPDDIARLGLSLGESNIPLIASLRVLGAPLLGTGDVRCPL